MLAERFRIRCTNLTIGSENRDSSIPSIFVFDRFSIFESDQVSPVHVITILSDVFPVRLLHILLLHHGIMQRCVNFLMPQ